MEKNEYTLEFLLAFDGRIHWLEEGYWLKFEVRRIEATPKRPHSIRYSLTLHDPVGKRRLASIMLMRWRWPAHALRNRRTLSIIGIERKMTPADPTNLSMRTGCYKTFFGKSGAC